MNDTISFQTINWPAIEKTLRAGESGHTAWQTVRLPGLRIRLVEYSAGYKADHWCSMGHIVHCLSGQFVSELSNGQTFALGPGMSYVVTDNASAHRSESTDGACLLIIDGDFLQR